MNSSSKSLSVMEDGRFPAERHLHLGRYIITSISLKSAQGRFYWGNERNYMHEYAAIKRESII